MKVTRVVRNFTIGKLTYTSIRIMVINHIAKVRGSSVTLRWNASNEKFERLNTIGV